MAIRITRVYTRTGDKGVTKLVGGKKVSKDSARIESYGTIDELNAVVGVVRAFAAELPPSAVRDRLDAVLERVQNELFDLGSELATPAAAAYEGMFRVGPEQVKGLERVMDECQKELTPLNSFILPGGGKVGSLLHQCRTVCRRAERDIVRLGRQEDIGAWPLAYVNRLSDLFFVLSRWVGKTHREPEHLWGRGLRPHARRARKDT